MKHLPNINKPVPEMSDPANIKVVSDAIEAAADALGLPVTNLTTTAKSIVPAINELKGKVDTLEAKNSLLAGTRYQVAVTNGLGLISKSILGVNDVASHRWLVQAEHKDAILFVCPRLYSNDLALYVRNQLGNNPPDGTYPINVIRLS